MKMLPLLLTAAIVAAEPAPDPMRSVVLEDWSRFTPHDQKYIRYIRWDAVNVEPEKYEAIQAYWWPHLSRERVLSHQVPVKVAAGLYRIDLRGLGWSHDAWLRVTRAYPYRYPTVYDTLHVRGDWLVRVTSDAQESTLYYDLLYGVGKAPKTRDEFFKLWNINTAKDPQAYVIQKGDSGVAHEERLLRIFDDGSETFDSENAIGAQSPLEQIGGKLKFDAQELIAPIPKIDIKTGERSFAQAYLLTDANKRVEEASTRIVVDHTNKLAVVTTPGSCARCHTTGLLSPPKNQVREMIARGGELYFKDKALAQDIEAEYLGLLDKRLKRQQEDFSLLTKGYTNLTVAKCVAEYAAILKWYDSDITLDQAAIETHSTKEELTNAIAYWSAKYGPDPQRANIGLLLHERTIPRKAWEKYSFAHAHEALALWRKKP